jgi:hypothetical protein
MITVKQQSMDKEGLQELLKDKKSAKASLGKIDYTDKYKDEERTDKKSGKKKTYQVLDKGSDFRTFLEAIGVSNSTKNEVIKAVKASEVELTNDIALITTLISIKK